MNANDRAPRVLLVEDEEPILDGLDALFSQQGFLTTLARDGEAALRELFGPRGRTVEARFDLIVLDLMLPRVDGLTVLRRVRERGQQTPVLVLTAKGSEEHIVAGLEAGADDYMSKPFGVRELLARARGLLRRPQLSAEQPRRFLIGQALLDLDAQHVRDGAEIQLTTRETSLLGYLIERRHRPVSRAELLVDVWGYRDGSVRTRTVDVHVQQLRAKLRDVPGAQAWIQTVRGRGYRFVAELERPS
ncbi:MAG TPA: response regulator transcription factor [Polyangiaceae bacterium]|nr:response regulator transcription factor [Polyangiaceae bacterium]